ncbi:MAG: 6-phosphogluconolactonase [Verrucomicrobiia bacterium]
MDLHAFPDQPSWLDALLDHWNRVGGQALLSRGEFFVALSGGSTPASFYRALAQRPWSWEATRLFIGDERWVPHDDPRSNYRMIYQSFYPRPVQIERWKTELPRPEDAALDYARRLKHILRDPPRFDLLLLGIGNDGHTASLFPSTSGLHETQALTTWHYVDAVRMPRLTFTYPLIHLAREVWFLATGPDKKIWIDKILSGATDFPAARVTCATTPPQIFYHP